AKAVAAQLELAAFFIPKGDGELPAELFPHALLVLLPQVRDDFGVAMSNQPVPPGLQFGTAFHMVEEFPIEDDEDVSLLVGHWLLTVGQANDAQTPGNEAHPGAFQETLFIGASMKDGATHHFEDVAGNRSLTGEIDHSCNSAHGCKSS